MKIKVPKIILVERRIKIPRGIPKFIVAITEDPHPHPPSQLWWIDKPYYDRHLNQWTCANAKKKFAVLLFIPRTKKANKYRVKFPEGLSFSRRIVLLK